MSARIGPLAIPHAVPSLSWALFRDLFHAIPKALPNSAEIKSCKIIVTPQAVPRDVPRRGRNMGVQRCTPVPLAFTLRAWIVEFPGLPSLATISHSSAGSVSPIDIQRPSSAGLWRERQAPESPAQQAGMKGFKMGTPRSPRVVYPGANRQRMACDPPAEV